MGSSRTWLLALPHPLPYEDGHALAAINRALRAFRLDRQGVALEREEAHLIASCPRAVPRDIDMMGDFVALYRVRAGVSDHRAIEHQRLIVGRGLLAPA